MNDVETLGEQFRPLSRIVTLCYRRDRHRPNWPYNLFCMIHGRDREISQCHRLKNYAAVREIRPWMCCSVLRRFKQRGARLSAA